MQALVFVSLFCCLFFVQETFAGPNAICPSEEGVAWSKTNILPLIPSGDSRAEVTLRDMSFDYLYRKCSPLTGCNNWTSDTAAQTHPRNWMHWQCGLDFGNLARAYLFFHFVNLTRFTASVKLSCTQRINYSRGTCPGFDYFSLGQLRDNNIKTTFLAPHGGSIRRNEDLRVPVACEFPNPYMGTVIEHSQLPVTFEDNPFTNQQWEPFQVNLTSNCFSVFGSGKYKRSDESDPNIWFEQQIKIYGAPVSAPTPAPTPSPTPSPTPYPTPYPTPSPYRPPSPYPTPSPYRPPSPYPTPSPTPARKDEKDDDGDVKFSKLVFIGMVVGVGAGGFVLGAVIVAVVCCLCLRKPTPNKNKGAAETSSLLSQSETAESCPYVPLNSTV
eukprot:TRINITY_DN3913_c0_g1_i4.p1 TRINITY_DN3913_c0_g1~~TRINITY_DN3913_c0_g1_i4.p1  ORF type:complete len:384 (-),score=76.94 TRINITY_DN3913_c0_g1_i4:120-1271(-)